MIKYGRTVNEPPEILGELVLFDLVFVVPLFARVSTFSYLSYLIPKMSFSIDNHADLKDALSRYFNANNTSDAWVLLNYVNPHTVHFAGSQAGGPESLEGKLLDDQVQYHTKN